jgi:lysophospholipase L1-like esterase
MMKSCVGICFAALCLAGISNGQVKVACIGNSITEGYGLSNASTQSYPSRLQALLGTGYKVQNDGASGRTMLKNDAKNSYWKFGKLGQALAFKPDIVAIELGTNDANNFAGSWSTTGVEFKRDYLAMIDTLRTLQVKPRIFVVQPLPIRGNNDATLVKANALIKEVAAERGVTVVDCYAPFKNQTQLYADGLHPNAAGADTMAHIVYRAIMRPPVTVLDRRPPASHPSLIPDFAGSGFSRITDALAGGGRFRIRIFDVRGSLRISTEVGGKSPGLEAIHSHLKSYSGLHWISMEKLP